MNNTGIFQYKYLKYKNKYQILKNKMIQKGSGQHPYECLVFNKKPMPFNDKMVGFYDIGNYATADHKPDFTAKDWKDLEKTLKRMGTIKAARVDNLSYWLNLKSINTICNILSNCILPNGIVFIKSYKLYNDDTSYSDLDSVNTTLGFVHFKIIGTIGIKNKDIGIKNEDEDEDEDEDEGQFYTLYSRESDKKSFSDWTGININTKDNPMMPYVSRNVINPKFEYIEEATLFEFINTRIISPDLKNKNQIFVVNKQKNIERLQTLIDASVDFNAESLDKTELKLIYEFIQEMPLDLQTKMLEEIPKKAKPLMLQIAAEAKIEEQERLRIEAEATKAEQERLRIEAEQPSPMLQTVKVSEQEIGAYEYPAEVTDSNTICIPNPNGPYDTHIECSRHSY